jgi:hypothetical protein
MFHIQILGIGCKKTKELTSNVKAVLAYLSEEADVEEITGVDEIVHSKISSIPALLIEDHVVSQGVVPTEEDILNAIRRYVPVS